MSLCLNCGESSRTPTVTEPDATADSADSSFDVVVEPDVSVPVDAAQDEGSPDEWDAVPDAPDASDGGCPPVAHSGSIATSFQINPSQGSWAHRKVDGIDPSP
jgi:hypothetical protein